MFRGGGGGGGEYRMSRVLKGLSVCPGGGRVIWAVRGSKRVSLQFLDMQGMSTSSQLGRVGHSKILQSHLS